MLKKAFQTQVQSLSSKSEKIILFPIEKEYALEHQFIEADNITITEELVTRFPDIYVETVNKETDDVIIENNLSLLEKEISYVKEHIEEYVFIESNAFDMVRIDSLSIEVDSVFRTYEVMFGLKYPKKEKEAITMFFNKYLSGDNHKFSIMFNNDDGLWDVNLNIEHIKGFSENNMLSEVVTSIYSFLFDFAAENEKKVKEN